MKYKIVEIENIKAVGKTFEFETSNIQTADYSMYYGKVCQGMNPTKSYGIYEVGDVKTKFTVAIETEEDNDYENQEILAGQYYEFEIDFMENQKDNQYIKCFDKLVEDKVDFDSSYSFEIMDRNFNPMEGKFLFKYYIKK